MGFLAQMVKCSRMLVTVVAPGYGLCLRASQGDQSTTHPLGDRVLTSSRVPPLPARHIAYMCYVLGQVPILSNLFQNLQARSACEKFE